MVSEKSSNVASISDIKEKTEPTQKTGSKPPSSPPKEKSKPTEILPTSRIQFSRQLDLLRAYAAASGQSGKIVSNNDVSAITKMHANTISLSNAFFVNVGLLVKTANGFLPSKEVVNFSNAHQWNPEVAPQKLGPLLKEAWFAEAILPKLSFRSLPEDEVIEALAEVSSASKDFKNQLKLLVDFLEKGGLIRREGGNVHLVRERDGGTAVPNEHTEKYKNSESGSIEKSPPKASLATMFTQSAEGVVQFNISVRVDMGEFKEWQADRIAAFFGGIAQVLAAKGSMEQEVSQ